MTKYCEECDQRIMPVAVDGNRYKCPVHGWMGEETDMEWTPERMRMRINQFKRLMDANI